MKKSQSIIEYVLFAGVIAVALAFMQVYAKRGLQASLKETADTIGTQTQSIGFQSGSGVSFNGTQDAWVKGKNSSIYGTNKMSSIERSSVADSQYSKTDISSSESTFSGGSIGDAQENLAASRADLPGVLSPGQPDKCGFPDGNDYSNLKCFRLTYCEMGLPFLEQVDCNGVPALTDRTKQTFFCIPSSSSDLHADTGVCADYFCTDPSCMDGFGLSASGNSRFWGDDKIDMKTSTMSITKDQLGQFTSDTNGLFNDLQANGYIDKNGVIQSKFGDLTDYSSMVLGSAFMNKQANIYAFLLEQTALVTFHSIDSCPCPPQFPYHR